MIEEPLDLPRDLVVMGIARRLSPETAPSEIPELWRRFTEEGLAANLPRQADDAYVYAVYGDYESDRRGACTMVLGVAVPAAADVPAGMRRVRIPRGRYGRFVSRGEPGRAVWETWSWVNERWEKRSERRYIADFERYAPDAVSGGTLTADVIVGLS